MSLNGHPKLHHKLSFEVKQTFLHHLRHLLRECTYLPDPASRKYFHNHVLERFRDFRPRTRPDSFFPPKHRWILDKQHEVKHLHKCRQEISFLYRAGVGDIAALTKVLYETYGRSGKRRHELLKPYLQPNIPADPEKLAKLDQKVPDDVLQLPDSLKLLGKTQSRQQDADLSRVIGRFTKYTEPVLPALNTWGRPMPKKRIKNAKRAMYNELLQRLLPPLPQSEWEHLRRLATGEIRFTGPPTRRARQPGLPELRKLDYRHELTPRFMRRLWGAVFLQCSTMNWDAIKGQWKIVWGSLDHIRPQNLEAGDDELYLFGASEEEEEEEDEKEAEKGVPSELS